MSEKCCVCNKEISGRKLIVGSKNYHAQCFVCCECKKSLEGKIFNTDSKGNVYCIEDYGKKFAPKCHNCKKPIVPNSNQKEGLHIRAMGEDYHINCFKCEDCHSVFNEDTNPCFQLSSHILCKKCFKKRNE